MIWFRPTLLLAVLWAPYVHAQTADDLAAKYNKLNAFEVRPGVLMTARFGRDGRLCQMVLQRDRYPSENQPDLRITASKSLGKELTDELAPMAERGALLKDGATGFVSGNIVQTRLNYENLSIDQVGGFSNVCVPGTAVIVIRWKNRGCAFPKGTESHSVESSAPVSTK